MPEKAKAAELTPHEAVEHYERAIKEDPKERRKLYGLGRSLLHSPSSGRRDRRF